MDRRTPTLMTYSDEGKPIPIYVNVTQARVEHYSGVISMMTADAVNRFLQKSGRLPSPAALNRYNTELLRLMTIGKQVLRAQQVEIIEPQLLNEQYIFSKFSQSGDK